MTTTRDQIDNPHYVIRSPCLRRQIPNNPIHPPFTDTHLQYTTISTMFTVSWPSLPKLGLSVFSKKGAIDLRPVKVHESETAQDRPGRALKHLLKLNHVEHGLFVRRSVASQLPEVCLFVLITLKPVPFLIVDADSVV